MPLRPMKTVLVLACALLLRADGIRYDAPTDREIRPKPPLPEMGRAGSVVRDPAFGSRILRVTDGEELGRSRDGSCTTPAAALQNPWNADSTRFVIICDSRVVAYEFDPEKLSARRAGRPLDLRASPAFSYANPDLVYGIGAGDEDERKVIEYDFRRRNYREALDLDKAMPGFPGRAGAVTVSANDRIAVAFGGIQDTFRYVLVADLKSGARKLLDTRDATLDGKSIDFPMGWGVHLVNIDKSGRYAIISKGEGGKKPNLVVWDTETDRFGEVHPKGGGHYSAGYGWLVNGNGWFPTWAQWLARPLEPARLESLRKLIAPELPKDYGGREEHSSWANARPDAWMPVFVSVTRRQNAKNPPAPWDDEIIAISTDPDRPAVWRFAHHRSVFDGKNFWDTPRGNVSPDGRFFLFTSNWEKTLGATRSGRARQDAFLLELPVSGR